MKNTFLVGVAAAALLAGVNVASAQMERQPASGGSQPAEMNKGGAELKGKAGADVKAEKPATNAQAPAGNARAQDNMKADTKGQAADTKGKAGDSMKADTKAQGQKQDGKAQNAQSKDGKGGASAESDSKSKSSTTAQGSGSGNAKNLTVEQKTKIRQTVIKSGPRVTNVNFSLSVGTVVPRTVKFAPVPTILVEYYPEWRGYRYFIVNEEIVIIEPDSLKIVTILHV